ncbi:MAG TPA: hypothetical protein VHG28_22750 [Longimicrobiaceae bacterium]|nr:hypothetical protein [Longimicrobiaceae bacterium]
MKTLVLQCLVVVLTLSFGIVSLRVSRHQTMHSEAHRTSWLLTGIACVILGANGAIQNVGAVWAFLAGPGTVVYQGFIRWTPVGNHSRNVLSIAFAVALLVQGFARLPLSKKVVWGYSLAFLLASGLGGWYGWEEGSLVEARHYLMIAVLDGVQMIFLFLALLQALRSEGMDRLLWVCLVLYAVRQALNVFWWSGAAWVRVPGAWHASLLEIQAYSSLVWTAMLSIAGYRLFLARRGVRVPALIETPLLHRPSYLG